MIDPKVLNETLEAIYVERYGREWVERQYAEVRAERLAEAQREEEQRRLQEAADAHWAAHGCTQEDHDWEPREGGRLCRRCRGWNVIVVLP